MCIESRESLSDSDFDLSQLRLYVWSTPHDEAPPSHAAGTTASLTVDDVVENQLMYVVLSTVLGVVVLIVVVCIAMCTWRHQRQPRRAVGMCDSQTVHWLSSCVDFKKKDLQCS